MHATHLIGRKALVDKVIAESSEDLRVGKVVLVEAVVEWLALYVGTSTIINEALVRQVEKGVATSRVER